MGLRSQTSHHQRFCDLKMSYSPLSSRTDSSEALLNELGYEEEKAELIPTKQTTWPFSIWILHLILFSASLGMFVKSYWHAGGCESRDDVGYERLYCKLHLVLAHEELVANYTEAPLWEAVRYERQVFYSDVEAGKKFMGKPRPELDEAWASITDGMYTFHNSSRFYTSVVIINLSNFREQEPSSC